MLTQLECFIFNQFNTKLHFSTLVDCLAGPVACKSNVTILSHRLFSRDSPMWHAWCATQFINGNLHCIVEELDLPGPHRVCQTSTPARQRCAKQIQTETFQVSSGKQEHTIGKENEKSESGLTNLKWKGQLEQTKRKQNFLAKIKMFQPKNILMKIFWLLYWKLFTRDLSSPPPPKPCTLREYNFVLPPVTVFFILKNASSEIINCVSVAWERRFSYCHFTDGKIKARRIFIIYLAKQGSDYVLSNPVF